METEDDIEIENLRQELEQENYSIEEKDPNIESVLKSLQEKHKLNSENYKKDEVNAEIELDINSIIQRNNTDVENQWKKCLEEDIEIEKIAKENSEELIIISKDFIFPRLNFSDKNFKIIPIYDLILDKCSFHSYLINEYECKRILKECTKKFNDRYDSYLY